MTAPAPVPLLSSDADALLCGLAVVGAITESQADDAARRFHADHPGGDASVLADQMVQAGLITPFQAERALVDGADRLELGRYLLVEQVGGGIGTTYRAVSRPSGERFAVRVLPMRSSWRVLQARKRLETFAALPPHPVVVPFTDVDSAAGRHYLAWPWSDGRTLDRLVLASGPLPPAEAARLFAEFADGLRVCHAAGFVHGMLRPRSLQLGLDRQPRLLDLGVGGILADNVGDERSMVDTLALASGSAAMIDYAAPETLLDPAAGSPAADAYSFGCCLYFALTGLPPFPDEKLADKVIGHHTRTPVPVRTRNPAVPPLLADLLDQFMRKAADERPVNFADVRAELRAVAELADSLPELPSSVPLSVTARTLAAVTGSSSVARAFTRRADLPPASDVIDFDDVPIRNVSPPPDDDSVDDTPSSLRQSKTIPNTRPHASPTSVTPAARTPLSVQQRLMDAEPTGRPRVRTAVTVPPPPMFDLPAFRAAKSVLFWRKQADAVQLSVFGPPLVPAGGRVKLLVYAHLPEAFGGVTTLCRALNPEAELLGSGYVQRPIPRDSTLGLHLNLIEATVTKPLVEFPWAGQTHPRSFDLTLSATAPVGVIDGLLSAGWQEKRVGEVPFQLVVTPPTG